MKEAQNNAAISKKKQKKVQRAEAAHAAAMPLRRISERARYGKRRIASSFNATPTTPCSSERTWPTLGSIPNSDERSWFLLSCNPVQKPAISNFKQPQATFRTTFNTRRAPLFLHCSKTYRPIQQPVGLFCTTHGVGKIIA